MEKKFKTKLAMPEIIVLLFCYYTALYSSSSMTLFGHITNGFVVITQALSLSLSLSKAAALRLIIHSCVSQTLALSLIYYAITLDQVMRQAGEK